MAYIGKQPVVGNFQICDAISVVNGQAAYTMQVSSVNVSPESANHMIVSLNGTIQKPNSSYTVSGSTITFSSNLATGDVIDFIQILGDVLDLGVPSDATVTTAKLADSSVSLAKLTATGTKDATTFLRGDNTFAAAGLDGWSSNSGNLLPADASKGIYLGVNSATAANLLNDYEEGTFTPTWGGSSSVSVSSGNYGYYTKIGNVVTVHFGAILTSTSNSYYQISNAPFQSNIASGAAMGSGVEYGHTGSAYKTSMGDNSTTINVSSYQNNAVANAYFHMSLTYRTD